MRNEIIERLENLKRELENIEKDLILQQIASTTINNLEVKLENEQGIEEITDLCNSSEWLELNEDIDEISNRIVRILGNMF